MAPDLSEKNLVEKLRRDDPEQFYTLVRMHLSFVLDLHTDESESTIILGNSRKSAKMLNQDCQPFWRPQGSFQIVRCDSTPEKVKIKPKWTFVPFPRKTKCLAKGVMEGAPLTQEGICQVYQLILFLSKEQNICQEGIFRRSGKLTRQNELKTLMNQGTCLNLEDCLFSVHDCASVLKNFLAELPEPLLTEAHFPVYCQIADFFLSNIGNEADEMNCSYERRMLEAIQMLLLLLPVENRLLLQDLLQLLHLTASLESSNKMSADSLATLFSPHLFCPRKLSPEALHDNSQKLCGVLSFMIREGLNLFNVPQKLATDVKAYWMEYEKKKLTSKVNENMCDSITANTVFSFVDRELTAQASLSNPTEAALAQLYAHIQSLPESSKKRKLIKQFNRENGQGTPLKFQHNLRNHVRSKSLGDSIKKHIFKNGLKIQKTGGHCNQAGSVRSMSQEMLNSSPREISSIALFQENASTSYLNDMPLLQKSLCDSNSTVIRLRYTTKFKPHLKNKLICFDSESNKNEENDIIRRSLLKNLAQQIQENNKSIDNASLTISNSQFSSMMSIQNDSHSPSAEHFVTDCSQISTTPMRNARNNLLKNSNNCAVHSSPAVSAIDSPTVLSNFCSPLVMQGTLNNQIASWSSSRTTLITSTPAMRMPSINNDYSECKTTSLNHSFLMSDDNNSMSPISRSTQKMPKSMQETMMTPRSRKPVVVLSGSNLCNLANFSNVEKSFSRKRIAEDNTDSKFKCCNTIQTQSKSYRRQDCFCYSEMHSNQSLSVSHSSVCNFHLHSDCDRKNKSHDTVIDKSDGSLTSAFKSYLSSRSVLTASPVDLSFVSRTSDFDNSFENHINNESFSDSLLYCLNGNKPDTTDISDDVSVNCAKTSFNDEMVLKKDNFLAKCINTSNSNINDSKNSYESENSVVTSNGIVHETSL